MTIWLINEYAGSQHHGMSYRHYYLAREWQKHGIKVIVISGAYSHFLKNLPHTSKIFNYENVDGIQYIWIKVLKYGKSNDKRRVIKWFEFAFKLFLLPFLRIGKPDIILCSPTAPLSIFPSYFLSKLTKSRLIFEVRDIWPLTLIELGGYSKNHPFIKFLSVSEKFALKKADFIVSNLPNYGNHIQELGLNRVFTSIPNGVIIDYEKDVSPLNEKTYSLLPKNKFIVGYAGTLGNANSMEYFIQSMHLLKEFPDICAVIVGSGKNEASLKELAANLDQVYFLDPISKNEIPSLLQKFDVCYIGWRKLSLYENGVSPNKIFDYMLSGKPILHSISTKKDLVKDSKCGTTVEAENPKAIAEAILKFYHMNIEERVKMGNRGKEYVKQYHDYKVLADNYIKLFEE